MDIDMYIYIKPWKEKIKIATTKPSKKGNIYQINAFILKRKRLTLKGLLIM